MSGTPLQNNVEELYSQIRFLRIKPYNSADRFSREFTRPLKRSNEADRTRAMQQFQVLLKAILLRRTKMSKINGAPILQLPPKTTEVHHAVFSHDESEFYKVGSPYGVWMLLTGITVVLASLPSRATVGGAALIITLYRLSRMLHS